MTTSMLHVRACIPMLVLIVASGCGSGEQVDPVNGSNTGAVAANSDSAPSTGGSNTVDSASVSQIVAHALQIAGMGVMAIRPSIDPEALFASPGTISPCPSVDALAVQDRIEATLDYGSGCAPLADAPTMFSGQVLSRVYASNGAVEHRLSDVQVGAVRFSGSLSGTQFPAEGSVLMYLSVDLVETNGVSVRGLIDVEFPSVGTSILMTNFNLVLETAVASVLEVSGSEIRIDPGTCSGFLPCAGSADVSPVGIDANEASVRISFHPTGAVAETVTEP